jgi:glycine/D-amino acid oxidase-like deaminating enzyme
VDITHCWSGYVAMNRDMIPRIFSHEGLYYAAGYCGSGVVWARWTGQKVALHFRPPRLIPFYNGKPWFMPAFFGWYELQDRLARRHRR